LTFKYILELFGWLALGLLWFALAGFLLWLQVRWCCGGPSYEGTVAAVAGFRGNAKQQTCFLLSFFLSFFLLNDDDWSLAQNKSSIYSIHSSITAALSL
jgi:hypothetical protein